MRRGQVATAELRLKLADMMSALAAARIELADVQDELRAKDDAIRALKDALRHRDEVVKHWDAYYGKNEAGKAIGEPYCMMCWERDHALYHLIHQLGARTYCPVCKTTYGAHRTKTYMGLTPDQEI